MKRPTKINVMVTSVGGGGIEESVMKALRLLNEKCARARNYLQNPIDPITYCESVKYVKGSDKEKIHDIR